MKQTALRLIARRAGTQLLKLSAALSLAFVLLMTPGLKGETPVSSGKNAYALAYDVAVQSVVSIRGEKKFEVSEMKNSPLKGKVPEKGKRENVTGMGSGVIIDERGYIVTNYHVVKGLQKIQITTSDEMLYREVEFVSYDPKTDLALLKVTPLSEMKPIRFGRIDRVYVCQEVMAIGNPFGYSGAAARGIVSGLNRPLTSIETASYDSVIQTDAAINPGNSGGPLIDLDGEMIGINAAVRDDAQNIAFAIPVDMVADVVERMLRMSVAKMTHHGLELEELEEVGEVAEHKEPVYRVRIKSVEPNSPAELSGVRAGDILVESNRLAVHSKLDFTRSLIGVTLADKIALRLERNGQSEKAEIALSNLSTSAAADETLVAVNRPISAASAEGNEGDFRSASAAPSYASNADAESVHSSKEEIVDRLLGLTIEPVSTDEYEKQYPDLGIVSMDNYKIMPSGGVRVTGVRGNTLFSAGKSAIREGDLIFGFVVDGSAENRWEITSLDNLYFIARKWNDLAAEGNSAKIYLIRNGSPYFLDIPMSELPNE